MAMCLFSSLLLFWDLWNFRARFLIFHHSFIYEVRHSQVWHVTPGHSFYLWSQAQLSLACDTGRGGGGDHHSSARDWLCGFELGLQNEANKTHFLVGNGWIKLNGVFRGSVVQWVLIKASYSQPKITLGRCGEWRGHEKSCWQSEGLLPPRCDNIPDSVQSLGGPAKQDCSHDLYSNKILQRNTTSSPRQI